MFQIVGDTEKINTCLSMLNPFGILEMVRSGKMVITKGMRLPKQKNPVQHK